MRQRESENEEKKSTPLHSRSLAFRLPVPLSARSLPSRAGSLSRSQRQSTASSLYAHARTRTLVAMSVREKSKKMLSSASPPSLATALLFSTRARRHARAPFLHEQIASAASSVSCSRARVPLRGARCPLRGRERAFFPPPPSGRRSDRRHRLLSFSFPD